MSSPTGRKPSKRFRRSPYNAIVVDCQRSEMDGFEASRAIRELEGPERQIPIIALTATALSGERERCPDAGMDDYLSKPVTQRLLAEKLSLWLSPQLASKSL